MLLVLLEAHFETRLRQLKASRRASRVMGEFDCMERPIEAFDGAPKNWKLPSTHYFFSEVSFVAVKGDLNIFNERNRNLLTGVNHESASTKLQSINTQLFKWCCTFHSLLLAPHNSAVSPSQFLMSFIAKEIFITFRKTEQEKLQVAAADRSARCNQIERNFLTSRNIFSSVCSTSFLVHISRDESSGVSFRKEEGVII